MLLEYRILLLGDFYFGETYSRGRVIERIGYQNSLEGLYPFVECADYTVASFSAPIRGFNDLSDDVSSKRRTPHSADVKYTGKALRSLGVDAVNLANEIGSASWREQ